MSRTLLVPAYGRKAFLPSDLDNLLIWLRADDISVGDGNPVETWTSREGNSYEFTQGTAANRPLLDADGIGGKPAVDFDGINDGLLRANDGLMNFGTGNFSIFVAFKDPKPSVSSVIFAKDSLSGSGAHVLIYNSSQVVNYWNGSSAIVAGDASDGNPHYFGYIRSGTGSGQFASRWDGAQINTGVENRNLNNTRSIAICAGSNGLDGDTSLIAEIIVYSAAISGDDLTNLESYLSSRYGI